MDLEDSYPLVGHGAMEISLVLPVRFCLVGTATMG